MIEQILDLHIHSKYSRACSKHLELPAIAKKCEVRGIDIVVTGDMTHPAWYGHIKEELEEVNDGIYGLRGGRSTTRFLLGSEVAVIKKHKGKTRRIHLLIFAPNLEVLAKFNAELSRRNFNLKSDGRPILGMPARDLLALILEIDERMVMIPAHAWTPWFGVFGSKGGYDSLEEGFDELTPHIFAIETGLSSDPLMNWRCSWLDNITLVSNSDAHSSQKLGREANVLCFEDKAAVTYDEIMRILREQDKSKFVATIEFYPEEGKYFLDGHRDCEIVCTPEESEKYGGRCPKCRRPLTIGVMNRVYELADRSEDEARRVAKERNFIPYESMVPLPEILADVYSCGVATKRVTKIYDKLISALGSEFGILRNVPLKKISAVSTQQIAVAIDRVRKGTINIHPGYDGVFGKVKVFGEGEDRGGVKHINLL